MVVIQFYWLNSHLLGRKSVNGLNRTQIGQTQLDYDTFSLYNNVIFKSYTSSLVQKQLSPSLPSLGQITWTSEFLQFSFHKNQQLLNCCSFLEHDFVCFLVLSSHSVEESILISFEKVEKHSIFLNYAFHIIFEHDFSKISSYDFCQSLATKNLTHYIFFGSHSHPSDNIIVKRILTKTLAFVNFSFF